jgi:hypothetical protein
LLICNGNTTPEILKRTKCQGNEERKGNGVEENLCFEWKNIKYFLSFGVVQLRKIDKNKREKSCSQFGEFLEIPEFEESNELSNR